MKFKCKMNDAGSMRDFTNVANTVARMSKQCVLRLTQNSIYFNIADDSMAMVWTKLDKNHFFVDYLVAGKSVEFNEIYMELNTGMLAKSVTSLKTVARSVKIKLTNKQQPCLTFDIELSSISAESRLCIHDVPVTIIPQKKWSEYNEPNIERYDISLEMPQFKHLRSVMERIKSMSPILILSADTNGVLAFKVDTNAATITVHFPNLTVLDCTSNNEISASVDIKKFHAFLAWEAVHPTAIKCNILNETVININLNLENYLQIKYYIPAIES
ncbi:PREDICTED: checkpoint protein HUS1-like [Ceratosolen solmsi marchali]|uniref:Checkpoint protein n=1 Tax=Ceratosolen solmsi marchali TaxID=326594 RepID=A0AAJ6YB23_9HYME|nr:PREDICTED: checkpoint protein HUS1-like [Ceratosolen solmsi marchali]